VVFKVAGSATKPQIKAAIEAMYDVKVVAVNTLVQGQDQALEGQALHAVPM
jgi:large subunit ribosomal protein L23